MGEPVVSLHSQEVWVERADAVASEGFTSEQLLQWITSENLLQSCSHLSPPGRDRERGFQPEQGRNTGSSRTIYAVERLKTKD